MEQTTIMLHDFEDCLMMYSKSNLVYIEEKFIEYNKLEKQLKKAHAYVKALKSGKISPYDDEIGLVIKKMKSAKGDELECLSRRKNILECKAEQYFVCYDPDDVANCSVSLNELKRNQRI